MSTNRKPEDGPAGRKRSTPRRQWELRLYIADREPRSAEAWANLNDLCEQHLPGLYRIEVVDLLKYPARSREDEILALPTVVRRWPQPEKRVIGRLSDPQKVLAALELRAAHPSQASQKPAISRGRHS
jgi:circadian clock protein KaiB